jgi:hypothetical protein
VVEDFADGRAVFGGEGGLGGEVLEGHGDGICGGFLLCGVFRP